MWEVAGLLFLVSETKDMVEKGMGFFSESLLLSGCLGGAPLIFFLDKDFDYINVVEDIFPGCLVFLCFIHTRRYFKDKVFTGKAQWKDGSFLSGGDKENLLKQVTLVRDAPTCEAFMERENKLLDITRDLSVRAGQAVNACSFQEYYLKNWKPCAFRWVLAYRRNLPTKGCNDTQAVESTFSALKRYSKSEFGTTTPTLTDLINVLPKILDQRTENRQKNIFNKRLVIYHKEPRYRTALEKASWELNAAGMRVFNTAINMCDNKEKNMKLTDDDHIEEKYMGKKTAPYIGKYQTDGTTCNCSWFAAHFFCRHIIFYRKSKDLPIYEQRMFHSSFFTHRFKNVSDENLDVDVESDSSDIDERVDDIPAPASPGMEHLLNEEMEANKKLPKNVKYNEAFDVAKLCAEYLKNTPNQMFKLYLEAFKGFSHQLRDGLSLKVLEFLSNPAAFELKKIEQEKDLGENHTNVGFSADNHSESEQLPARSGNAGIRTVFSHVQSSVLEQQPQRTNSSPQVRTKEVPPHLHDAMQLDCLIKLMPRNGACLFNAFSEYILAGVEHMETFRKECHRFIVKHWDYYEPFIHLPFTETVGVGVNAKTVQINTYSDMKRFLLSDDSLYCFSNSSLDLSNVANMYDMKIAVFTYSSGGSVVPHWTWVHPDPAISSKSPYRNKLCFKEIWLLHEDDVHYDLLIARPLPAPPTYNYVPPAPESSSLSVESASQQPASATCSISAGWISEAALTLSTAELTEIIEGTETNAGTIFSPMNFMNCEKAVGRQKKKRFGAPSVLKTKRNIIENDKSQDVAEDNLKRGRSRPKGSKNKQKDEPPAKKQKVTTDLRQRAEDAAYFDTIAENSCNICMFAFNDPIKKDKPVTRCKNCNTLVHEPCLLKSGCISDDCFLII